MSTLFNIALVTCVFGILAGSTLFLYRLSLVFLDYVGCRRPVAAQRYVDAQNHENQGAPTLDPRTSAHVQRALTVARKGGV